MANITAALVNELRRKTGSGMMECKKALVETNGDIDAAVDFLRERGILKAAKKADRIAAEGIVESYIHAGGRIGVLIEVNIETDFAANNVDFKQFVKDMAMQVAAAKPLYVKKEEVPDSVIEHEKDIIKQQIINEGKPEKVADKITEGRISKYYEENCLLEQEFVKNPDLKIKEVLQQLIAKIGENIQIRRFTRYELGEGIEKREENFAEEVMKQMK